MKNSNDTNGDRARDLPTFSAVPQLTAPWYTPTPKVLARNYPIFYSYINFEMRTLCFKDTYLSRINMTGVDIYSKRMIVFVE